MKSAHDIAANLRQSGAETDYLKTASHFGVETVRADLKNFNVGIVNNSANNPANDTASFLNALKKQEARD